MGSSLKGNAYLRLPELSSIAELAQTTHLREGLQWFGRERLWINEQHVQLCRIPAPTFLGGRRAEWMVRQLRLLAWDARIAPGGNVIACPDAARGIFVELTDNLNT